ncbi:hypothetical protein KNV09_gp046 [Vibrio phage Athena]|uniref:Uncharacterized protein n=3 Tax=Thalassavirus TaxID=2948922 RepID=A0A6M4EWM7_9CAUD|nr:hypothetical protein KNU87_gp044 [Vibrio phage Bennett]YP_010108282.1 hypothetical protein KNV07_gp046 [Vibrio phage Cody]YP_010108671.1 hypothetical protein KNV09_gp046 [Vibrio phage Athena]QKE60907.1 hypothetical protein DAX_46 [Vibrio phage Dax]QKN84513.1 hypothetical protein BBMUFFIN_47 [Vibrio phage BBMuffin]QKN85487.1 hypothetical protein DIREPILLOW8_48 [Vibrio phage Direpillow8]WBU76284.1 hypothetical protein WYMAN_45 [Vibrio phage Wyman]WBU76853.1 hypothetical protein KRONOS_47 [V
MTELRKIIFDKRSLTGALVQAAGGFLDNPVENKTWKEVEEVRREIAIIRERVNDYLTEVDQYFMNNCEHWQKQWDLAQEVFLPYNEPYNPDEIDIETLSKEFQEKGLVKELANQVATTVKYPIDD